MLKMTWSKNDIKTLDDLKNFVNTFNKLKPRYGSFDTETNGLHIIRNTPFLLVFGIIDKEQKYGHTWTLDLQNTPTLLRRVTLDNFIEKFNTLEKILCWNAKFDLHMMTNHGRIELFKHNISDTQIYVRLAHEAIPERFGGVSMKLKNYAQQYLDPSARDHEKMLREEQRTMNIRHNQELQQRLYSKTGKKYPLTTIYDMLKDRVLGIENVPEKIRPIVQQWLETTLNPDNYENLNRDTVTRYAHYDVIYTLEAFIQTEPVALKRKQNDTIKLEEDLIYPLYHMERIGFNFNETYTLKTRDKLKKRIIELREQFKTIAEQDITVNQHAKIKEILNNKFNLAVESTGDEILSNLKTSNTKAQEFIQIISELRSLEKWYVTYIIPWLNENVKGRVYTTIHQTGTVSGRVSSNFQQWPAEPILDSEGNELFHPREMIKVSGNGYDHIAYLDYSQIELRFQAMYSILIDEPDLNLCRAFLPYQVIDPTLWKPTDLHSQTTKNAFGIDETHLNWKKYRDIGKRVNFACNYGAAPKTLSAQMNFTIEEAKTIYQAYLNTFPGIIAYRKWVAFQIGINGYVENLFGRKYYGATPHKASSYLIQGSAADFLKIKIIEITKYLQQRGYLTRFQMNIHDELSFEIHKNDPPFLITMLASIMQTIENAPIPIVVDVQLTTTTWRAKK